MAGKRHHTIPQFLLRGFSSSQRGNETKVWLYRKGAQGVELNTANVAVEQYFYGRPDETDLDKRITDLENDLARLIDNMRNVTSGRERVTDDRVPFLVAHLSFRTRHLRESVSSTTGSLIGELGKYLSQPEAGKAFFASELAKQGKIRDGFKARLLENGVPPEKLDFIMKELEPYWGQVAENMMSILGDQYPAQVMEQVNAFALMMPQATKGGFIDSMSRNLTMEERVAWYAAYTWFICAAPTPLILSDSTCIFETKGARRFKPLDVEKIEETQRIYLPLCSKTLLVGVRGSGRPDINWSLINKASARCSYEFFISSREIPAGSHLIKSLGVWSGLLDEKAFHHLLNDVTRELH